MRNKVKICCFAILGILVLGGSVSCAYANAKNEVLISTETETLPDGNILVTELYEEIP